MGRISKSLRFEVLTRDGYRCRYCGVSAKEQKLQVDHVLPRAAGGRDDLGNLVAACQPCNYGKADRKIIGIPDGFALTPDKRPARLEKLRRSQEVAKAPDDYHEVDCYNIDSLDEIDEYSQLSYIWCNTHQKYEWHSIDLDYVRHGGYITIRRKEVSW
ncbi:HNH endonuclease [Qipengyuania sp. MTN3-11]|uniref:HNH endonuclease n=1 Tax=Qipengyuania sp. MTN3-11 TaxID=3056557 RepID=UPI0036F31BD4